jgi:hypothetical protein
MENSFELKYGYCELPKNLLLYRSYSTHRIYDAVFFSTKFALAGGWGDLKGIEIWRVKRKIRILFLIKHVNAFAAAASSIPELYYDLFPNETNPDLKDLDIKQVVSRRDPFTRKLKLDHGINGWLSSLEDHSILEVCLFNCPAFDETIERIKVVDENEDRYKDSLRKMKLFPPVTFFQISKSMITENVSYYSRSRDHYGIYRKSVRETVKEEVKRGVSESQSKEYHFDLRLKLKI